MRFAFRKFEALNEEGRRSKREELNQERAKARKQVKGKGPIKNKRIRAVARENKKKLKIRARGSRKNKKLITSSGSRTEQVTKDRAVARKQNKP